MGSPIPPCAARLQDRRALITGASGGLGSAIAARLAAEGADLCLTGRRQERLRAVAAAAQEHGVQADVLCCDLSDEASLQTLRDHLEGATPPYGVLINAAGAEATMPFLRSTPEQWRDHFELSLTATLAVTQSFGRALVRAKAPGAVVTITSVTGLAGMPGLSIYGAAKGALIAWTRSLAVEWARSRIRVNAVAAGHVAGEMMGRTAHVLTREQLAALEAQYPLGFGAPEDVAAAAAYLASDDARWVTGSVLVVDGGLSAG